jgi:hypothetical protein
MKRMTRLTKRDSVCEGNDALDKNEALVVKRNKEPQRFPLLVNFEWDEEKNLLNIKKHGISFQCVCCLYRTTESYQNYIRSKKSIL